MNSLTTHRVIIAVLVLALLAINVIMPAIEQRKNVQQTAILLEMVDAMQNKDKVAAGKIFKSYSSRFPRSYASTAQAKSFCELILGYLTNPNIRLSVNERMRVNAIYDDQCE